MSRGRQSGTSNSALLALAIVAFAISTAVAGVAHAAEGDAYGAAVEAALGEYRRGNWAEARALFLQAHELQPSARTLRTLGMVAFEMRDYMTAHGELSAALVDSRRPLDEALRAEVRALLKRTEAFVSRYRLTLEPETTTLLVDGEPAPIGDDGTLLLAVGSHTLSARAPGHAAVTRRLRAEGSAAPRTLTFVLTPTQPPPGGEAAEAPALPADPTAERPAPRPGGKPWTWITASAAVAFGATAFGLHMASRAELDALGRECDRRNALQWGACTRETPMDESKLDRLETLTLVSAVLGSACATTAIVLSFVEGDRASSPEGAWLRVGPSRVQLEGRF